MSEDIRGLDRNDLRLSKQVQKAIIVSTEEENVAGIDRQDLQLSKEVVKIQIIGGGSEGPGVPGPPGKSAYQIAVANGFVGTEQQWLESLKGEPGIDGKDGPPGLDGKDGEPGLDGPPGKDGEPGQDGTNGTDGKSAYQLALDNGFIGSESEWLDSLIGPPGEDGTDGEPGSNGTNGKSAYEIAVANGYIGTEVEWLASLKGATEIASKSVNDYGNTYPMGTSIMRPLSTHFTEWRTALSANLNSAILVVTERLAAITIQHIYTCGMNPTGDTISSISSYKSRASRSPDGNNTWNAFTNIYPIPTPTYHNPNGTYKITRDIFMEGPSGLSLDYTPMRFEQATRVFGSFEPTTIWNNISGNAFTPKTDLRFNGQWSYECTLNIAMDYGYAGEFMAMVRFCVYNNQTDADSNNFSAATVYDVFQQYANKGLQHMQFYMPPAGGYNTILKVYMTSDEYVPEFQGPWWTDYSMVVKLIGSGNLL